MQMLGGREGGGASDDRGDEHGGAPQQRSAPAARPAAGNRPAPNKPASATGFDNMDDDIPF
jgi:single-strand DNA-binding protein